MRRIATEILELEWDDTANRSEIFEIEGYTPKFFLNYCGLFEIDNASCKIQNHRGLLSDLMCDYYQIKKLPWKPKLNELYYYADLTDNITYSATWFDGETDNHLFEYGLIAKTREEAGEILEEKLKLLMNKT
jgi:hypothetical protein